MELEALHGVNEYLTEVMTNFLKDEIHAQGKYSTVSREEIEAMANRMALQQMSGNCTDESCLADMGKALGTRMMVYGNISKVGKTYSLSLRLLDTDTKEPVNRVNKLCKCNEEDLFVTVGQLANELMGNAPSPPSIGKVTSPATQKTTSDDPNGKGSCILSVESIPTGAEVSLGNRKLGVTPYFGSDLPAGEFDLTLNMKGHNPLIEKIRLQNHKVLKKSFSLTIGHGSLTVLSTPSGATVWLDGKKQKEKTPLTISNIRTGQRELRVHVDRYYDHEGDVQVDIGVTGMVNIVLKGGQLEECEGKWLEPVEAQKCRMAVVKSEAEAETEAKAAAIAYMSGEFVSVKGGCYQMGDQFSEGSSLFGANNKPVHEVCLDDFQIGKYEITQGQWKAVMGDGPMSRDGDNYPVDLVSWTEIPKFINKLNSITGKMYRLPTEAEWEYACRSGGKKEKYCGGDSWQIKINGLGIHDMNGSVWEIVQDRYDADYYSKSPRNNPLGPAKGKYCVLRGGSRESGSTPAAKRLKYRVQYQNNNMGFRLVLPISK